MPDEEAGVTRYAIEIPGGLSFLATGDPSAEVRGLEEVPRNDWPNVDIVHLAFQVMVGIGTLLMFVSIWFWWSYWRSRGELKNRRWLLAVVALSMPLGFVALEAGWFVTEAGRQPWVIHQVLRTEAAVTPAEGVLLMFVTFTSLYILLGTTVMVLLRKLATSSSTIQGEA